MECIRKTCFSNHRPCPEFSNTSSPHESLGCPVKMQTLVQTQRTLGAGAGTQSIRRWWDVQLIVGRKQCHFRGSFVGEPGLHLMSPQKPGLAPAVTEWDGRTWVSFWRTAAVRGNLPHHHLREGPGLPLYEWSIDDTISLPQFCCSVSFF